MLRQFQKYDTAFKFKDNTFELKTNQNTHEINGSELRRLQTESKPLNLPEMVNVGIRYLENQLSKNQHHFCINQTLSEENNFQITFWETTAEYIQVIYHFRLFSWKTFVNIDTLYVFVSSWQQDLPV